MFRDQQRAVFAYEKVAGVKRDQQKDYKIEVNDLGTNVMRLGLAGAMSALEKRSDVLRAHIATAAAQSVGAGLGIPGLEGVDAATLPQRVRKLETDDYILASREILKLAAWLKRAVQATFTD